MSIGGLEGPVIANGHGCEKEQAKKGEIVQSDSWYKLFNSFVEFDRERGILLCMGKPMEAEGVNRVCY